ncbi:ferric reductase transmembrane component 1 [Parachaetomium inaequale]|uniref:Ferric reductase transmembrane component 1 n=1 Tax=Parachaetomium inaequale TaxID=2588326 RepID=A0AAN6PJM4_9PEZI|nr:ferric reductase transmembrane component 1 [Parachaetomium inaequale]
MDRTQVCLQMQGAVRQTLPRFMRAFCPTGPKALTEDDDLDWMNDPEKVEYIRQLLESLYEARAIVNCYTVVIVLVILVLAVCHWRVTRRDRRKWLLLRQTEVGFDGTTSPTASSSRSTVAGTATPPDVKDVDVERVPLLPKDRTTVRAGKGNRASRAVRSWLARQPPPLPVVNRTLPSNGTSLFILAWLALNVFFHLYRLPLRWDFFFIFADRTGCVFIVNLPLLYLLSAKNQPLRRLTGYSYEALNIFHRRVGELLCFEAALHFVSMLLWQFLLARDWLIAERSAYVYFTHPIILCGIGALVAYELLYFSSLASFRQRWYELFLASHVVLQIAALAFLWFHFETSQPYVAVSLLIFFADRLVWRLAVKRADLTADLCVLDKDTYTLSADWDILPSQPSSWWQPPAFFSRQSVLYGWHPTDHVFLNVPTLGGRTQALQAHPFTIASAAPGRPPWEDRPPHELVDGEEGRRRSKHAWFTLLIRAHDGFTRDLLRHALTHRNARVPVRLDGPYGSSYALDMLRAARCAVLVAGGSGIAVVFPLVWALLHEEGDEAEEGGGDGDGGDAKLVRRIGDDDKARTRRRVHLLWVTHSREHREWVPSQQLGELVERGLELVIPEPTVEAGRPDVVGVVGGWIEGAAVEGREVGVVVSGPDGLNRAVRNVCADEIGRGREVRVAVEKFGW